MAARRTGRMFEDTDELDRQIIDELKRDGRASNQKVARNLGLSAAAVGARIRRLERDRLLRMVLVSDFEVIGCELLLTVRVRVRGRSARLVAQDLAALPEVFSCSVMVGAYNIELLVALPDIASLQRFLETDLAAIEGVSEVSTDTVVDMLKYDFDIVPFTR